MDLEHNGIIKYDTVDCVRGGWSVAVQSCRVALGPEARDAIVFFPILQVLRRDTAH